MAATNLKVGFGLMTVACKREVATVTKVVPSYLCVGQPGKPAHEASPRRQPPYVCAVCGPITDNDVLVRGVKSGKTYTLFDGEAAAEAKDEYAKQYGSMLTLVPHPAADFMLQTGQGKALHYLTPADQGAAEFYAILAKLIEDNPQLAFVGLYTPKTATALFHLSVRDGVIVMAERTRTEAMRPMPSVGGEINEGLYAMLTATLDTLTEPYNPDAYEDRYEATLAKLLDEGETLAIDSTTNVPTKAMTADELMDKLKALQSEVEAKTTTKKKAKSA